MFRALLCPSSVAHDYNVDYHHTQGNIGFTTHKGSQLLKLMESRYQIQPNDKKLHTEQTPLRTITLY